MHVRSHLYLSADKSGTRPSGHKSNRVRSGTKEACTSRRSLAAEHGSVPDRQGVVVGGLVFGRGVGEDAVGVGDVLQAECGEGL